MAPCSRVRCARAPAMSAGLSATRFRGARSVITMNAAAVASVVMASGAMAAAAASTATVEAALVCARTPLASAAGTAPDPCAGGKHIVHGDCSWCIGTALNLSQQVLDLQCLLGHSPRTELLGLLRRRRHAPQRKQRGVMAVPTSLER